MTQADSHGVMAELEAQMDEYYEAAGMDRARSDALLTDILATATRAGIVADCGIDADEDPAEQLLKLDNYLCDLRELQIRDGLHVFGLSPSTDLADGLLAQILRTPRGDGEGANASLPRAIARDLGLAGDNVQAGDDVFDPLTAERAVPWHGKRPSCLVRQSDDPWRSTGDTVERIDSLAAAMVAGRTDPAGPASALVIEQALVTIREKLDACGREDGIDAARPGRTVHSGGCLWCAHTRTARSSANRAKLLLDRQPRAADTGGLASWLGVCRRTSRRASHGSWQLAAGGGAVYLGHLKHAHRW